jgi:hypothetical protein
MNKIGFICVDGSLTDRNGYDGAGIHCKLFSFYLSLEQHATHFDVEIRDNEYCTKATFQ